jgi:hypothetical protein
MACHVRLRIRLRIFVCATGRFPPLLRLLSREREYGMALATFDVVVDKLCALPTLGTSHLILPELICLRG